MRRPAEPDYSCLFRVMQACGIHIYRRQIFQCSEVCHHLAVITAQKFIARSCHVNIVRLVLGTLLVHELENWFVCRSSRGKISFVEHRGLCYALRVHSIHAAAAGGGAPDGLLCQSDDDRSYAVVLPHER